jgi:hypothetical protein
MKIAARMLSVVRNAEISPGEIRACPRWMWTVESKHSKYVPPPVAVAATAGVVRRQVWQSRIQAAVDTLLNELKSSSSSNNNNNNNNDNNNNSSNVNLAALGWCFGGTCVSE